MLRIYSPEGRVPVADVREVVLRVRQSRKLTQGQLAKRLRVSRKLIERIEQEAVQTVDVEVFKKIQALEEAA